MTQKEYQIFKDRVMNRLTGEEANHSISQIMENDDSEDQTINVQAVKKGITARNHMEIKDKPQFKRKRAKVIIYSCAGSVSQLEVGLPYSVVNCLYGLETFMQTINFFGMCVCLQFYK